ncbi:MAG: 30S ribosomal protein S6 [Omnitrophica WOR_2 bacterium GWA2_47_8]|nr:MAG: 30S ribosomal protein S6 [Omnitrophica WOR_2 bacterium GWA2_47_8]
MGKYELVTILNASLSQEEKDAVLKEASDLISKTGGKVINSQVWLDRQKMHFPMKKCTHGTYYLINLETNSQSVSKVSQELSINDRILRFLFIRLEK